MAADISSRILTVNVVEVVGHSIAQVIAFPETPEGVSQAESLFGEMARGLADLDPEGVAAAIEERRRFFMAWRVGGTLRHLQHTAARRKVAATCARRLAIGQIRPK